MNSKRESMMFPLVSRVETSQHPHYWRAVEYAATMAIGATGVKVAAVVTDWHHVTPSIYGLIGVGVSLIGIGIGAADGSHHLSIGLENWSMQRAERRQPPAQAPEGFTQSLIMPAAVQLEAATTEVSPTAAETVEPVVGSVVPADDYPALQLVRRRDVA